MSWQPQANQQDVQQQSGLHGWEAALHQTPDGSVVSETTGGSLVDYGLFGAHMVAGDTAGDRATLQGQYGSRFHGLLQTDIIYHQFNTNADLEIGWLSKDSINSDVGAYLDVSEGQYHVGGTTASANTPPSGSAVKLSIQIDPSAGETRFRQRGAVNEDVTIQDYDSPQNVICHIQSNGGTGNKIVSIYYVRQLFGGGSL